MIGLLAGGEDISKLQPLQDRVLIEVGWRFLLLPFLLLSARRRPACVACPSHRYNWWPPLLHARVRRGLRTQRCRPRHAFCHAACCTVCKH